MPAIQDISAQFFSLHAVAYNLLYAFFKIGMYIYAPNNFLQSET